MAIVKDLGMVTAYAYAVAGGYEGTEAEFEEMLGRAGIVVEQLENLSAVAVTLAPGSQATASYSEGVLTFGIPRGDKGEKGDAGNGISSIAKTGTSGLTDTYTITYTDGTTTTFTVTNGAKGEQGNTGNGIVSITKTGTSGLVDTYTITFTDGTTTTFTVTNGEDGTVTPEQMAQAIADALGTFSGGTYENMTAGNAEQLLSTQYAEDSAPYLFRPTGGGKDVGNREYDEIVGGSVVVNQLVKEMNDNNYGPGNANSSVLITNEVATVTASARYGGLINKTGNKPTIPTGHKVLGTVEIKLTSAVANAIRFYLNEQSNIYSDAVADTGWQTVNVITEWNAGNVGNVRVIDVRTSDFDSYDVKNVQLIDLTKTFGSSIADYAYTLEQATAGSGIAWLKSYGFFGGDYIPYNVGTLAHVSGLTAHDLVGFNQWDEEWEVGTFNENTGEKSPGTTTIRSKNRIRILPGMTYFACLPAGIRVLKYDANGNYINADNIAANTAFTFNDGTHYINFRSGSAYGTTYKNDICINLSDPARNGEYEPYVKHSYPLDSNLTLRGIPMLADGQMYYDGDVYAHDGTVTRKYGIRSYQSGDESLTDAITDGTNTVYKLTTATTETATAYQSPQICDPDGTEQYVTTGIPVGHNTQYPADLKGAIERVMEQVPEPPTANGTYTLKCTVSASGASYAWTVDT